MRVLLVNQYFWPDRAATAQLLADLAEDLAASGWQVTVVAGRGSYAPGREGKLPTHEVYRGVAIRRVWCTDFGRGRTLGRLADYATFMVTAAACLALSKWGKATSPAPSELGRVPPRSARSTPRSVGSADTDPGRPVVVCLSTPPLVALLGLLARLRGAAFVYKVEDLYPDVAVALGTFGATSLPARGFGWLSRLLLRRADAVVALDGGMREILAARGARRVEVIRNWADGRALPPDPEAGRRFRAEHGLNGQFVVLYAGNLGLAHRFDAVVAAARLLEGLPWAAADGREVRFLFVGDGPRLAEVRRGCEGLARVSFLPYQPREALPALYNAADVHLVTLRDEVAGLLVPSKIAAALACARPVVLVGATAGTVAAEIRRAGAGWCCPHDAEQVATLLARLAADPAAVAAAGQRAHALFRMGYDRTEATGRWRTLLAEIAGARAEGDRA